MTNSQGKSDPEKLMTELHDIADEFEEEGWDTIRIRPGAVSALTGEVEGRFGLDVVVSRDKFDEVFEVHEANQEESGSYELFRKESAGRLYFIIGVRYPDVQTMVFYPSITDVEQAELMFETAKEHGEMRTRLRPLSKEHVIEITHDEPELFYGDENAA